MQPYRFLIHLIQFVISVYRVSFTLHLSSKKHNFNIVFIIIAMKYSKFNNVVYYKDNKYFLYNALSNKFILVESLLKELLLSAHLSDDIDGLEDIHPTFFKKLVDDGFLVDDFEDEIENVKALRDQVDLSNESEYILTINPTMNCNFSCWYCYESHIKESKMEQDTLDNVINFIKSVVRDKPKLKYFTIAWFGGEPLLQYQKVIKPIQKFCMAFFEERNIKYSASFTTNGFLINNEMIDLFKVTNVTSFQITLDGNRELHNNVRFVNSKRGSYDEIVSNILLLCRKGFYVALRINYTKTNLIGVEDILQDIEELEEPFRANLEIAFRKVWQEGDTSLGVKVRKIADIFRNSGFRTISGGAPDNVRNSCYADKNNHATINYNGDIFKCTARNFSSEAKEGTLNTEGEIIWNQKYYDRLSIKFKNKPCLECSIMPICNGGCSQKAIENIGKDYCVFNFDETAKKEVILNKLLELSN